jgi:3-oxoacyl-[acyl-carrier protein] reductase
MRTALIVGGSGGIGSVIAVEYAKAGYNIVLTYGNNQAKAEEIVKIVTTIGRSAKAVQVDVANPKSVEKLFANLDILDVMVFSVANEIPLGVDDATYEQWRAVMGPMTDGAFLCTHYAVPLLKKSDNPNIIYLPSREGTNPNGKYLAYQTSEAAMITMTRANAKYLGKKYKIRVNSVCPGSTRTPLWDKVGENTDKMWEDFAKDNAMGRVCTPTDVARTCLSLTEDPGKYLNGNLLFVNGEGEL